MPVNFLKRHLKVAVIWIFTILEMLQIQIYDIFPERFINEHIEKIEFQML